MVNINIEIPNELHKRARIAAALADITLKEYVIRALERHLPTEAKR
jgi:predicted HicB family RNase H-like nuclease